MTKKDTIYINPLGKIEEKRDTGTLATNSPMTYNNNINKLKKSIGTINARVEDTKLSSESHYMQLSLWSISAGISILGLLLLIRSVKK